MFLPQREHFIMWTPPQNLSGVYQASFKRSTGTRRVGQAGNFPGLSKTAPNWAYKIFESLILRGCRAPAARVLSGSLIFPLKPEGTGVQINCDSEVLMPLPWPKSYPFQIDPNILAGFLFKQTISRPSPEGLLRSFPWRKLPQKADRQKFLFQMVWRSAFRMQRTPWRRN